MLVSLVILLPAVTIVQSAGLVPCGNAGEPRCELADIFKLTKIAFEWILKDIATPLAGLMIVIGGVMMLVSAGNPGMISRGKQIVIWSIIAWFLMFASVLIINTVFEAIGFSLPTI